MDAVHERAPVTKTYRLSSAIAEQNCSDLSAEWSTPVSEWSAAQAFEDRMSRRLRSWRFEPLAELRHRLGLTGSFCERVAVFPRRHRLGLRPGPLGLVCHSIFKRNGVRDLAYLHHGSLLAERESNWRDHVPERKDRQLDVPYPGGI
jgi:hypothetical protein